MEEALSQELALVVLLLLIVVVNLWIFLSYSLVIYLEILEVFLLAFLCKNPLYILYLPWLCRDFRIWGGGWLFIQYKRCSYKKKRGTESITDESCDNGGDG